MVPYALVSPHRIFEDGLQCGRHTHHKQSTHAAPHHRCDANDTPEKKSSKKSVWRKAQGTVVGKESKAKALTRNGHANHHTPARHQHSLTPSPTIQIKTGFFSTKYKFVWSSYWNSTSLCSSVRFELSLFRDLMVYLESSRRRQWNSMVMSSDASMTGWGLTGAFWPREIVSSVEHTSERSRFRRCEEPNTRDHAFQAAILEPVDPCTEYLRSLQEDAPNVLWIEDLNFPAVSAQYFRPMPWKPKGAGIWAHKEDILVLESTALHKAHSRVCHSCRGTSVRQ